MKQLCILIILLCFSILEAENMNYTKAKIKNKSQVNGGYSQNGKVKYQYINGTVNVLSNKVNIASTKGQNKNRSIENNVYGKNLKVEGRNGYSSRHRREANIGVVDLESRNNRNVKKVETYIDNLKIRKSR